jgi:predicted lipoprotein with Yx(FWY)xxD motif
MAIRSSVMLACAGAVLLAVGCRDVHREPSTIPAPATPVPEPAPSPSVPDQPNQTGADLGVSKAAQHGDYLVDATGKAVYTLDKDGPGTSTCHDACARAWPPLLASQGAPKALEGVDQAKIGTFARPDGMVQVTYGGRPLYHFEGDRAAGQLNGHDRTDEFGHWQLARP